MLFKSPQRAVESGTRGNIRIAEAAGQLMGKPESFHPTRSFAGRFPAPFHADEELRYYVPVAFPRRRTSSMTQI